MGLLEVKDVNKRFGGLQALGNVNLSVRLSAAGPMESWKARATARVSCPRSGVVRVQVILSASGDEGVSARGDPYKQKATDP